MSDVTQLADQALLQGSLKADHDINVSKHKSVISIPDANQGSYSSGYVEWDSTTALTGANGFASLKDAYITIPYVISAKAGVVDLAGSLNRFVLGLKANTATVVDTLELSMNKQSILTAQQYKSFWRNLRAQTECSQDYIQKHGAEELLFADNWYSINYSDTPGPSGDGYSNNAINVTEALDSTLGQTQEPWAQNHGLATRQLSTPMPVDADGTHPSFGWASLAGSKAIDIAKKHARGCWVQPLAAGLTAKDNVNGTWIYMLKIKLTSLHPIFNELDLISNPQLHMRLRINTGSFTVVGTSTTAMALQSSNVRFGSMCPVMMSSSSDGSPMKGKIANTGTLSVSYGCLGNDFNSTADISRYVSKTQCELHVPFYQIRDPRSIISKPVKEVRFLDCKASYYNNFNSVLPDGSFQFQVPSFTKNTKYVALIPFADTRSGYWSQATAQGVQQFASPFDSAPWTCQAGGSVSNFQVSLGNTSVFQKTQEYDFESFMHEFSKLSALDGDFSRELSCGLVDIDQWTFANRVMVADVSRISEKDVPSSIQVSGTNSCSQASNYLVLVIYERAMAYDRLTGELHHIDP